MNTLHVCMHACMYGYTNRYTVLRTKSFESADPAIDECFTLSGELHALLPLLFPGESTKGEIKRWTVARSCNGKVPSRVHPKYCSIIDDGDVNRILLTCVQVTEFFIEY